MSLHRVPIRWRLTAWYAFLLALALLLFSAGLYLGLRVVLYDNFAEQSRDQADLVLSAIQVEDGEPELDASTIANLANDDHFVRLFARDGRSLVDTTASLGSPSIDPALLEDAQAGETRSTTASIDGHTFVVVTQPVMDGAAVVGVFQTGTSRVDIDEILRILWIALALAAPAVLLAAIAGGYLLSRRALAPVAEITRLAATISAEDLHARLGTELRLPDDELGRLAHTFDRMLDRIEDAFERQRRFAGDAAHELRTPLSLMRSQVDLALARPRTVAEHREALVELDDDLNRMTRLVAILLTLARADSGQFQPVRGRVDLGNLASLVVAQYGVLAGEARVAVVADTTPAFVDGDQDMLLQLLINLVDNALAHTPPGGQITVGCGSGREGARLWVTDSGSGIPPKFQSLVFDRFFRVDPGRSRDRGGAGLGLSICQAIVHAHGGSISFTSDPGRATTFLVVLPAYVNAESGRPGLGSR